MRSWSVAKFALDIGATIHNYMAVDTLDTTFAALSDPTRRAMVEHEVTGWAGVLEHRGIPRDCSAREDRFPDVLFGLEGKQG